MWTPPINESAELTWGREALYLIHYSEIFLPRCFKSCTRPRGFPYRSWFFDRTINYKICIIGKNIFKKRFTSTSNPKIIEKKKHNSSASVFIYLLGDLHYKHLFPLLRDIGRAIVQYKARGIQYIGLQEILLITHWFNYSLTIIIFSA